MSKIIQKITSEGLQITGSILARWGWPEGTEVVIEPEDHTISIRPKRLTADAIADRAGTYIFEKVGDAVAAEPPEWDGEKWQVTISLPAENKILGKLTFSADGQLISSESDSPRVLEARANENRTAKV